MRGLRKAAQVVRAESQALSVCWKALAFPRSQSPSSTPIPHSQLLSTFEACDHESRDCAVRKGEDTAFTGLACLFLSAFGFGGLEETLLQAHPFSVPPDSCFIDHKTEQDSSGLETTPHASLNILQQEGCPHAPESQVKISA